MKKFLIASIASNVITFVALTYFVIKSVRSDDDLDKDRGRNCEVYRQYDTVPIPGVISAINARSMSMDYSSDAGKIYVTRNGLITEQKDGLSLWFSIDQLKNYIWKIEKAVCAKNCNLRLGLRFYYAKYADTSWTVGIGAKGDYAFRHTLFAVPTFQHPRTNKHIDFDALYRGDWPSCIPLSFDSLLKSTTYLSDARVILSSPSGEADNHGGMCPPPAGSCTFPSGN